MSIGTEVILGGFRRIGATSIVQEADSEAIIEGMQVLNDMLQSWQSQGIQLGIVPLQDPGDELSEPAGTKNAIMDNFAILMAPNFDNGEVIVSQTLKDNARSGYNIVKNMYQKFRVTPKRTSSTMPLGQGNKGWRFRRTFAGRNFRLGR